MQSDFIMTECALEQLDNSKWWCPTCDSKKKRLLPVEAHRKCPGKEWKSSRKPKQQTNNGVGDHLHDLIIKFTKELPKGGCGCEQLIAQMNQWGPNGCRKRMEEIADHMMDEADKRKWKLAKWPGTRTGAKLLVRWAIKKTEKEVEKRAII